MKKILILTILAILFISTASAEIIISQQPKASYNLEEVISIPVIVKSTTSIIGSFNADLICNGNQINFYKNGVALKAGEEKRMEPSLVLTQDLLGGIKGNCVIKAYLGASYTLTNEFKISSLINLAAEISNSEIFPKEGFLIRGSASKESGTPVKGFIEAKIFSGEISANITPTITQLETINNGYFQINITIPKNTKAGTYVLILKAYEKDTLDSITNKGTFQSEIIVKQLPTNLEIFLETPKVEPGTSLKAKAILHDQTGKNIPSTAVITIKNNKDKTLNKIETRTEEFFEFPIEYNEPPVEYKIIGTCSGLETETFFHITEKQDIEVKVINQSLIIKNKGNVPYCNKTVLVKIGPETLNLNFCLEVDEEQRYNLNAPDGEYEIEIITDKENIKETVALTGKAIDIKKVGKASLSRHPFIWIFVIIVLGFVAFTVYKKGYKKSFIGYIHEKKKKHYLTKEETEVKVERGFLIPTKNRAEVCLSIKGSKQNSNVIGLNLKNFFEIKKNQEVVKNTFEKISQIATENKAVVYENQENIFFILSPVKTKTFQNEKTALKMAQELKAILNHNNKIFKQKIDFGISLNYGTIVAKSTKQSFEFMSMGDLMTKSKKIAAIAKDDFLVSETMRDKLGNKIKADKIKKDNINIYQIKEIKDTKENEKFIRQFLDRLEKK